MQHIAGAGSLLKGRTVANPRQLSFQRNVGCRLRHLQKPYRVVVTRASDGGVEEPKDKQKAQAPKPTSKALEEVLQELQQKGMTPAKAKDVLRVWAELGAKNPEQLKQLLVKRSLRPLGGLAFQTFLDSLAAAGGFYTGSLTGQADFPGSFFVSLIAYFFACYYLLQAAAEVTALVSLATAARKYSTNTEALLAAVQQLAGPSSGFTALDSLQLAVSTLKVIQTLDSLSVSLKGLSTDGSSTTDTLQSLSAYLALQRVEERYGFDPSKYGLDEKQALKIAGVFATFDQNDDGRLELSELKTLCNKLDKQLSDGELKEALKLLDVGGTGYVQFADFVEWFQGLRPDQATREQAARASQQE